MRISLVTYDCKDKETRDAFFKEVYVYGSTCKDEPGCYQYEYFIPTTCENKLFLLEKWENDEVLEKHINTENFKKIGEVKAKFGAVSTIERYVAEQLK